MSWIYIATIIHKLNCLTNCLSQLIAALDTWLEKISELNTYDNQACFFLLEETVSGTGKYITQSCKPNAAMSIPTTTL